MFSKKFLKNLLVFMIGCLLGFMISRYLNLRKDVQIYKFYSLRTEKDLNTLVEQMTDPYLMGFISNSFHEKFIQFDKLENDKMRKYTALAFFEYKEALLFLSKKTDIDSGVIKEINELEEYLCEKYDCSKVRKSKPDKKNIPKQQHL